MLLVNYIEESAIGLSVVLVKRANDGTICLKALQMCCNSSCVFSSCQIPFFLDYCLFETFYSLFKYYSSSHYYMYYIQFHVLFH